MHRLAWHVRLVAHAARVSMVVAGLGGLALPSLLPVTQAWLVAAVAVLTAVAAVALVVFGGRGELPALADVAAALERTSTAGLVAHALLRAAFVLGALALGLTLGGLLPSAR